MAAVRNEWIGDPIGLHERRVLAWLRSRASDVLAGRVVWCAGAFDGGHTAGRRLRELLDDDLEIFPVAVKAPEPPAELARQLDGMLAGVPSPRPLGAAARIAYARSAELAEPALGRKVRPGDVVVLHDCFTVSSAAALRERGAHVIWHLRKRSGSAVPCVSAAIDFLGLVGAGSVDAVLVHERRGDGLDDLVTAFLPAARLLDVRELSPGDDWARTERMAFAWVSLLGDIVEEDRADHVGGTIQARPVVAPR